MFICLCNGYRDREIRAAAETGALAVKTVFHRLGGKPRCGRCLKAVRDIIDARKGANGAAFAGAMKNPD